MTLRLRLFVLTGILLLIALSRFAQIGTFYLDNDELWSIFQSSGTPEQIVYWTSPTEYPTYFLLLGAWQGLAGLQPEVLRYLSLLLGLPAAVLLFQAVRRPFGDWAGVLAALAYSALPISLFIHLQVRSYVIAYTVLPLTLWLVDRYFQRFTWYYGLLLGLALYGLYLSTITIVPGLGILAGYVLLLYPRQAWRGLLPGIMALGLALPDYLSNKLQQVSNHSAGERMVALAPLPQAWFDFFDYFTRSPLWYGLLLLALLGVAIALIQALRGRQRLSAGYWLVWVLLVPLIIYLLEPRLGFFPPRRYAWWYILGLALLLGIGLVRLPQWGRWGSAIVMSLLLFAPYRPNDYGYTVTPLGENLRWLRDHWQADDALLLDPNRTCNFPEEWDYYTRLYFPNGLRFVNDPDQVQRLWLVASQDEASRAFEAQLAQGRVLGRFVGPPGCFIRLYEAPPDREGVLFENGMRFHGAQIMKGDVPLTFPLVFRESQPVRVRLWWSVDQPVPLDYSISLYTQRERVYDQLDSPPQVIYPEGAPFETSRWQPGAIYLEERVIPMPTSIFRGGLDLLLAVYWFGEPERRFAAPGVIFNNGLPLARLEIVSW